MKRTMKTQKGVQQLIGIQNFGRNGIKTNNHSELVFFLVNPTNISVLSQTSIAIKVRHLMTLLSTQPDIDICCMDACECFDENKNYLKERLTEETNPKVKALLQKDLEFLDEIQIQMSTAREFMFIVRLRDGSEEQSFSNLNRIEKAISEQGFDVKRAVKDDIKRFLCVYFGRTIPEKEIPDVDGGNEIDRWVIPN